MRYIRTKNGIYDIETAPIVYVDGLKCVEFWTGRFTSRYEKIIQEADTIEELCDEFVIVFEDEHIMTDLDYESFGKEWYKNKHIRMRNAQYYGAIWTSKGLIYVAKMNSEGKLVLI